MNIKISSNIYPLEVEHVTVKQPLKIDKSLIRNYLQAIGHLKQLGRRISLFIAKYEK